MGGADDLGDVDLLARAVRDVRGRDEQRVLVDRVGELSSSACTTRAPRASCACQIWPTVGNSRCVRTTLERAANRRPLASAAIPAEFDVVTAISSGSALTRAANAARAASVRSTQ